MHVCMARVCMVRICMVMVCVYEMYVGVCVCVGR